ncbi:30S ribosomal protein S16 [Janibacter sp. HTCC2649]|uniref:phosphotransferase enzyme family protein n=1 Tax=Janibacter sp. HTCC2649 TaxID=313589 RepID=UPI0000670EB2|nr:phosphotransferase [Janibacter sp. HTCC2649]EAP97736.1 30S ribosomal protein S16 [Janibacter sp. HTCC2649]
MDDFAEWVRVAFGLGEGPLVRTVGGRGADGDVWHLRVRDREYAVKRPFRAFDPAAVRHEAALLEHLTSGGVEVPTHVASPEGQLVVEVPDHLGGGNARVSHWVTGTSVTDRTSEVAEQLGTLLAQLHRAAPATWDRPRSWHTAMVPPDEWAELVRRSSGQPWHQALVARHDDLTAYAEVVDRAGPGTGPFVLGHCDLHPDNALAAPDGSLRALDWEDCGPVDPTRELAKTLVQWHVLGESVDDDAITKTVAAYRDAGGPGLLADTPDFAMVLCSETNFLANQVRLALDVSAPGERRDQARGEITEALADYLPSIAALERVLSVTRPG